MMTKETVLSLMESYVNNVDKKYDSITNSILKLFKIHENEIDRMQEEINALKEKLK